MKDFSTMTAADFAALQGVTFTVDTVGSPVQLSVIEVKALASGLREGGAFSVLWQGPASPALPQATYRLTGAAGDAQDIFLVPVARTAEGYQYEAVFT
ncbi:DUF6916 family protein [Oceanicola sp. S124]|uniref:DUF6916 family protein n=1 Tax=Oceanicola sp. S124 TaxID=1042378 RepID=UPI00025581B7|nr:hypothetical protein [Oceanicola sp. S124]